MKYILSIEQIKAMTFRMKAGDQALTRGRNGATAIRAALRRMTDDGPGPQTTAMLIAKSALALIEIERALNELDEIGRKAKNFDR